MTQFTDLTHEQRMLVHQATTEVYSRITSISTGAMTPLDAMAEFFMTAYNMGQQAPRPGDMVVAHFQENARSVSDGAIYAATSKHFSQYDKQLQNDIKQLLEKPAPYCPHCKCHHEGNDPCELVRALRRITAYAQESARRALDTTQPLVIDEPRINDVPLAPGACRHLNVNAQRVCVDCGAHLAGISSIDDERDDPHEAKHYPLAK